MKITREMQDDLRKTVEQMPRGSIGKIAKATGYSPEYVGKFFMGKFEITLKNEKIIDTAITILQEDIDRENRLKNKLQLVIN